VGADKGYDTRDFGGTAGAGVSRDPRLQCGVSHDHFYGFSAIAFAGFHTIRNMALDADRRACKTLGH
jgi:hypothetical protein